MKATDVDKLTRALKEIETKEKEAQRAQGQLEQIMKTLANDYGYKTIEDAKIAADKESTIIEKEKDKFQEALNQLENKYEWNG